MAKAPRSSPHPVRDGVGVQTPSFFGLRWDNAECSIASPRGPKDIALWWSLVVILGHPWW